MKREPFMAARRERWVRVEQIIDKLDRHKRGGKVPEADAAELPGLYRRVCQDLALASRRAYGRELVLRLNDLALRGREKLYRKPEHFARKALDFIAFGFPRLVRENARLFWLAMLLFYGPFLLMMLLAWIAPDALYAVLDPQTVAQIEDMYDPSNDRIGRGRESASDVMMFGFYIQHNVGIAFQVFAGGVLYSVGSIFALLYQGVFLGAVFAHLTRIGYYVTLYPFVVGHGAFELTAIVISGMAGLKLGFALLAPGRRSRAAALHEVGPQCAQLLCGVACMLMIAAFIEGFWSPSSVLVPVKYGVGAMLWILVTYYFVFVGRARAT
jgi:uncharacterized membrane protein SpoIIM required for sporulation